MAGWNNETPPAAVLATLVVLFLGVPAIFVAVLIGLATAIGLVVW